MVPIDVIRRAPKIILHDHLDGGLRPTTIVELAEQAGVVGLPATDPEALATAIRRGADSGSLASYLEMFVHTTAVMQTAEAIERVAFECAEDHHRDGVVRGEVRMAPELCTQQGLAMDDAIEAILAGFGRARDAYGIEVGLILTALRDRERVAETAEAALRWRDDGVVAFDIAGPETGHPPGRHLDTFLRLRREHLHLTIHAGESEGLASISEALADCGAERLGHGVRIVDDLVERNGEVRLGRVASWVRDRQVPLELCPTSNVHTAAAPSIAEHPFGLLHRLGFAVTVNTDNRLMSGVTLSSELAALTEAFGLSLADLEHLQVTAAESLFAPLPERRALVAHTVRPAFAALADLAEGTDA